MLLKRTKRTIQGGTCKTKVTTSTNLRHPTDPIMFILLLGQIDTQVMQVEIWQNMDYFFSSASAITIDKAAILNFRHATLRAFFSRTFHIEFGIEIGVY